MQSEISGGFNEKSAEVPAPIVPKSDQAASAKDSANSDAGDIGSVSWQAVLSRTTSGICVVDGGGFVIFENEAARHIMCGTSLLGTNVVQGLSQWPLLNADRKPFQQHEFPLVRALIQGEMVQAEDIIIMISAEHEVVVQVSAMPIERGNAKRGDAKRSVVLTLVDVTKERRALNRLATLNRSKDEFLAILSHELRTPLTPIMGWATLMRQVGGGNPEMLEQALAAIERNAELLKRLVNDLLDTTRLMSGKLNTEKNWCSLNEIAQVAAQSLQEQVSGNGVRLECSFDPDVPPLPLDRDRIHQVLMNLLSNAAKFSSSGGTIYLRTRCEQRGEGQSGAPRTETPSSSTRQRALEEHRAKNEADISTGAGGRCVVVEVEDQGAGVAPELLPHIFDMFRQGDGSYTRRHGGLGLGLTISKSLIEMHGGTLTASSGGVGQGAIFTVILPA